MHIHHSLHDVVGMYLQDLLGQVVAVLHHHQHVLFPDQLLDDGVDDLAHLQGFFG
jgi:hypothetical protein